MIRAATAIALLLGVGCGTSTSAGDTSGGGSLGAGGSSSAGTGAGGTPGTGGSSGTPGGFDSIWKRASAKVYGIDTAAPTIPVFDTVTLPPTNVQGTLDGRTTDIYEQIKDDQLITYAFISGDVVYYRAKLPLMKAGTDGYLSILGDASRTFLLKNGQLTETVSVIWGTGNLSATTTFNAYNDPFPPSQWPTQAVDLP